MTIALQVLWTVKWKAIVVLGPQVQSMLFPVFLLSYCQYFSGEDSAAQESARSVGIFDKKCLEGFLSQV